MFTQLTKAKRRKAGWLIALAYLLCVLAPGVAYAVGGNQLAAPCFSDDHTISIEHSHHLHTATAELSGDEPIHHDHASHHHMANDGGGQPVHDHDSKPPHGLCCAMVCTSGLPANMTRDIPPSRLVSVCALEPFLSVTGQGPARLYRPPIV